MQLGSEIIQIHRTKKLGAGVRSVWYLPGGSSVHAIEDDPIPAGTYFLSPYGTGKYRNWIIETELGSRRAGSSADHNVRTDVEVHIGNSLADSVGCTCPGLFTDTYGVVDSADAIKHLRKVLGRDEKTPLTWVIEIWE